ncbi:TonB-dependent receptor [Horticoccus sp. 23ND18S-11]|uniref:TonB-dependent receptor n=1 Tax=Horticoccus sp. 23ND18S-11 TaxID=3391832 RepID=UPI0039C9D527
MKLPRLPALLRIASVLVCASLLGSLPALSPHLHAADATTGTLTGTVSNPVTRNLLEGARIEVSGTGLSALTDNTGRYVLTGLPTGTHEIVATYLGLDPVRRQVTIAADGRTVSDFTLSTAIYRLDAFRVVGEREGDALAITAQRNAENVKNVVAMDSFGNLPNMSAGEVVMRLPGIAGNPTDEGLAYEFNVRGMAPGLNTVTVDGGVLPSIGASRSFQLQSITGTMFEQLELIKGHTPDKGADSLGGTLNMKTRSPLNMSEKRRLTYSGTVRVAPPFLEQVPLREKHRAHPLLTLGYQEVFDVFGSTRNLGVAVNLFYSENGVGGFRTDRDFQNTLNDPAYVWGYRTWDNYNNRKQSSLNVKTDYRYSFNSKFTASFTVNDNIEKFRRVYQARAYTGNATTVPNATTSGVIPGFTNRVTEVRPVASSVMEIMMSGPNNYMVTTYQFNAGGEHEFGPLKLDYSIGGGRNKLWNGTGVGYLTNRVSNVGWILDRTASDLYPRFVQTAGPDITNPANYRPIANGLTRTPNNNIQEIRQARFDAIYTLTGALPVAFKAGGAWREQEVNLRNFSRRWNYLGTTALAADPTIITYASTKTGLQLPMWEVAQHTSGGEPTVPALWREDLYYAEQIKYTGARGVTEGVTAGYVQAQGRFGREGWLARTGFLTGVRFERTDTESYGWVRTRFGSTAAQQLADPVGSARRDYANTRRDIDGNYTKSFPSVHLNHDLTRNLKARVSWSTSFGRPPMANLMPNETVNEINETVTVNNPSLLPQMAKNWDATLEYYFEPVGSFSVGWFHKTINDYIVSGINDGIIPNGTDNGYNGDYAGFTRLTTTNSGTAIVQGWEFSYQQQFTFLPGLLRGLSGSLNYTYLDTHGDFGGTVYRRSGQVAGFIPKVANASLSWRYRRFSTRLLYNFTGEHITSYSSTSPALNLYRYDRKTVSLGMAYQLRPAVSLTFDVANLFNEPQRFYVGTPDRMQSTIINFVTISGGISGRF